MAIYKIGLTELVLTVVGAGVRYGWLPEPGPGENISWSEFGPPELSDLEAFEAAGWRFHPRKDLDWRAAENINGTDVQAGLLATHPDGGLVVLRNHVFVNWPQEGEPPSLDGSHAEKLPLNRNVYDVRFPL